MNSLIVVCLALVSLSATSLTNAQMRGPLTGVHHGNLVETPRGLRPLDLEGFSEDLDEDGYVDPLVPVAQHTIAPAAVPIPTAVATAPVVPRVITPAAPLVPRVVTPAAAYAPAVVPHPFTPAYPYASSPVAHQSPFVFAHDNYPIHPQRYVPQLPLHTPHHVPHFGYGFGGAVNNRGLVF